MARNIYGLPAWQFKLMKAAYEQLPEEKKQEVQKQEIAVVKKVFAVTEQKLLVDGWIKESEGHYTKTGKIAKVGGAIL